MDRILFIVFDDEKKAYDGSRILDDLHFEGNVTLYSKAVVTKDANGEVTIKQANEPVPVGTGFGLLTGSLLGLLNGPAGFVLGAGVGMYGGMLYDLARLGVGEDFLYEAGQYLVPGKAAVVADVWEEWVLPVDTRMQDAGGVVFRRARADVEDIQMERDLDTLNRDAAEMKAEWSRATGEAKEKLQARIDITRAKIQAMRDAIKAKVKTLQEQIKKVRDDQRTKIEAHISEMKANQKHRSEELQKAWELAAEALRT